LLRRKKTQKQNWTKNNNEDKEGRLFPPFSSTHVVVGSLLLKTSTLLPPK
jgi:hypothetical protein